MLSERPIVDPTSSDASDSLNGTLCDSPVLMPLHTRHEVEDLGRGSSRHESDLAPLRRALWIGVDPPETR